MTGRPLGKQSHLTNWAEQIRPAVPGDADAAARLILEPSGGLGAIFGNRSVALRVARAAFVAEVSALSFERTLVVAEGGVVLGLVARFPGAQWPRLRVRMGLTMLLAAGRHGTALVLRGWELDRGVPQVLADSMYVMSLAVRPEQRSRGIGTALLDRVVEEAARDCLRAVTLEVAASNRGAVRFYLREGFGVVGESRSRRRMVARSLRMERSV